jgi:hypothetical protein
MTITRDSTRTPRKFQHPGKRTVIVVLSEVAVRAVEPSAAQASLPELHCFEICHSQEHRDEESAFRKEQQISAREKVRSGMTRIKV